jgi:hypothetical protein
VKPLIEAFCYSAKKVKKPKPPAAMPKKPFIRVGCVVGQRLNGQFNTKPTVNQQKLVMVYQRDGCLYNTVGHLVNV